MIKMNDKNDAFRSDYIFLSERFLAFEKKHHLVDKQYSNVYFWPLVRQNIYTNILMHAGLVEKPHHTVPTSRKEQIFTAVKYTLSALRNLFRRWESVDFLIVNHPRKVLVNGEYHDIYSNWLIELFERENRDYLVLDVPLNWGKHLIPPSKKVRYIENFGFTKKIFGDVFLKKRKSDDYMYEIENELLKEFGTKADFSYEVERRIRYFKIDYKYYKRVLNKILPLRVFYVVKNNNHPLIAVCNELKIPVEEIQHGIIHPYHMMYRYDHNTKAPYYPDRICLFGKYWTTVCPLPLSIDNFDYYATPITKYKDFRHGADASNRILLISQPTIGKQLVSFLTEVLKYDEALNYEWCYKLHPSEFNNWRTDYAALHELSKEGAVKVVDDFSESLFDLFKQHQLVIGVQSTAIFEALYFNCRVYIINLPTSEVLESMFPDQTNLLISKPEEFFNCISQYNAADNITPDGLFSSQNIIDIDSFNV